MCSKGALYDRKPASATRRVLSIKGITKSPAFNNENKHSIIMTVVSVGNFFRRNGVGPTPKSLPNLCYGNISNVSAKNSKNKN